MLTTYKCANVCTIEMNKARYLRICNNLDHVSFVFIQLMLYIDFLSIFTYIIQIDIDNTLMTKYIKLENMICYNFGDTRISIIIIQMSFTNL